MRAGEPAPLLLRGGDRGSAARASTVTFFSATGGLSFFLSLALMKGLHGWALTGRGSSIPRFFWGKKNLLGAGVPRGPLKLFRGGGGGPIFFFFFFFFFWETQPPAFCWGPRDFFLRVGFFLVPILGG